jgi:hypothetical protein
MMPCARAAQLSGGPPHRPLHLGLRGPAEPTNDRSPTFGFSSNEEGASFECRIDSDPFSPCSSPHTTAALADGPHDFQVRATDRAGNADPSPARRPFTVATRAAPEGDGDDDGIVDALDNCAVVANPGQSDLDRDGRDSDAIPISTTTAGLTKATRAPPLRQ